MSVVLVLKCAALGFALAVAATVGVLAGPLSAGLALVTFLLGVVTNELFQMRLSPVDAAEHAASDSALMALLEAGGARAAQPLEPPAPPAPPPPPKRNFRATCDQLATGSSLFRTELTARRRRHLPGAAPEVSRSPRPVAPRAEPAASPDTLSFRAAYAERVG